MHQSIMINHCINHDGLITQTPSLICRPRVAQPHPRTCITVRAPRGTHGPPRALWQPWPGSPRLPSCRTCATSHQLPTSTLHTFPLKQLAGSRVEVRVAPGHSGFRFGPNALSRCWEGRRVRNLRVGHERRHICRPYTKICRRVQPAASASCSLSAPHKETPWPTPWHRSSPVESAPGPGERDNLEPYEQLERPESLLDRPAHAHASNLVLLPPTAIDNCRQF